MLGGKKRFKSSKIILGCEHEEKKIHKLFFIKVWVDYGSFKWRAYIKSSLKITFKANQNTKNYYKHM